MRASNLLPAAAWFQRQLRAAHANLFIRDVAAPRRAKNASMAAHVRLVSMSPGAGLRLRRAEPPLRR
jgi:hypothetical protein